MSDQIDEAKRRYSEARGRQSASRTVLFQAIPNWPDLSDVLTPSQRSAISDAIRFEDELGEAFDALARVREIGQGESPLGPG